MLARTLSLGVCVLLFIGCDVAQAPDAGGDAPDGAVSDGGADAGVHDAGTDDAGSDDAGTGDAGTDDAGADDAGADDAGADDAGADDAGADDAGADDAGADDAGADDAGADDAGADDAGAGADDAGADDAGADDAGADDAGADDAGTLEVLSLFVTAQHAGGIELAWDAGALSVGAFTVYRDGFPLVTLPGDARAYRDLDAGPGVVAAVDAGASRDRLDGIELTWDLSSLPGAAGAYVLTATAAGQGFSSNEVVAARPSPSVTGWRITRGDGGTYVAGPLVRAWLDPEAPPPAMTGGTPAIAARADDSTSSVMLSTDASILPLPQEADYLIEPLTDEGLAVPAALTGARGGQPTLQWQRSTDDSPTTFVDLPRVHGPWWFDAEAVFNEGRYYRLVVKSSGITLATSAPARALLWRPRALAAFNEACILRDDGVVACSPFFTPSGSLHDVVTFVTSGWMQPCALHTDAGVTCLVNGVEQQVALPPVSELVGNTRLCGKSASGWVCTAGAPPVNELGSIFSTNRGNTICGRSNVDGGARCFSTLPGPATLELGAVDLLGMSANQVCAIADGGVRCLELSGIGAFALAASLPVPSSAVPYASIAVTGSHYGFCVSQLDGYVRCTAEWGAYWASNPPLSAEPFEQWVLCANQPMEFGCGLTPEHRLRCGGDSMRQLPPTQPVRQVAGGTGGAYFLLENGRLMGRRRIQAHRGPAPEDRFVQIASDHWTNGAVCGLRADGTVYCWSWSAAEAQPLPGKRYTAISMSVNSSCGLEEDRSISCWRGGWMPTGSWERMLVIGASLCGQRTDGSWSCDRPMSPAPPPGTFTKIASNDTRACGISVGGSLSCWPDPAPPSTIGRRFRDVATMSYSPDICALTVDGEVLCWGGYFPSPPWRDFVSLTMAVGMACGVRADQSAMCWPLATNWLISP